MSFKNSLLFLVFLFTSWAYGQLTYDPGYFISNDGRRTECLIKNIEWKNSPTGFKYKITENSEIISTKISDYPEFGLNDGAVFKRFKVDIDRSPSFKVQSIGDMSQQRSPIFKNEELYLKLLFDGEVDLYFYEDNNLTRYFYSKGNDVPKQLIYKGFKTDNGVSENNEFRQQLLNELKCDEISTKDVSELGYKRKELINFFKKYSACVGSDFSVLDKVKKKDFFNLHIRPGIDFSNLTFVDNSLFNPVEANFPYMTSFRLGLQGEFLLNFNKNKWSVLLESAYQSYKNEETLTGEFSGVERLYSIKYSSIDFAVGIRHYMYLNENSRFFINANMVVGFNLNSEAVIRDRTDLELSNSSNLAFGIGYGYKNFTLEARLRRPRGIFKNEESNFSGYSIILGYSLF
ncbi:outer membrane beta-barrel protein [Maribacter sp. 2308TA10-17]|uniref:outer membrane beta-barrel protein n=1 Tax=Maribacter sp. 2308TA10-17 TaxID=3386276 RepID=UPI0039BC8924